MMNYDAILVAALTLLQQETSEQLVGALPKSRIRKVRGRTVDQVNRLSGHF